MSNEFSLSLAFASKFLWSPIILIILLLVMMRLGSGTPHVRTETKQKKRPF